MATNEKMCLGRSFWEESTPRKRIKCSIVKLGKIQPGFLINGSKIVSKHNFNFIITEQFNVTVFYQ